MEAFKIFFVSMVEWNAAIFQLDEERCNRNHDFKLVLMQFLKDLCDGNFFFVQDVVSEIYLMEVVDIDAVMQF